MPKLYELLPFVLRWRDNLARGANPKGMVKILADIVEQELGITEGEIAGLKTLTDVDSIQLSLLPMLLELVGGGIDAEWSEEKQRMVAKAVTLLYHAKGMHSSWESRLRLYTETGRFGWEMWKHEVYEAEGNYSPYQDYDHPLKAARFGLSTSKTVYSPVDFDSELSGEKVIDPVRPVHVLPIRAASLSYPNDSVENASDSQDGSAVGSIFDAAPGLDDPGLYLFVCGVDGLEIQQSCVGFCEVSCQAGCTLSACESACQGTCEGLSCQWYCETTCQLSCEYVCMTSCAAGLCQTACMAVAQT